MLNKKHNLKSGKSKDKKKAFETEKQDRKPKDRENISGKKEIAIENVHVVLFMKAKKKEKGKRDKNKKQEESKEERQEGRKKDKRKRETEQEKQKKGEAKKGQGRKKEKHWK